MSKTKRQRVRDTYFALVKEFPLISIRDDAHLDEAIEFLNKTLANKTDPGTEDYIDALSDLIEVYEDEHVAIDHPGDAAMLKFLMDSKDASQTVVSDATGIAKSTLSEVLSGSRQLTRAHIKRLAKYFHVEQGVFELPD